MVWGGGATTDKELLKNILHRKILTVLLPLLLWEIMCFICDQHHLRDVADVDKGVGCMAPDQANSGEEI
jgi:hypothetical protein